VSEQVSFFELWVQSECAAAELQEDVNVGGTQLRMIRVIKPLRWFKIARIMKLGKAGPIIHLLMVGHSLASGSGLRTSEGGGVLEKESGGEGSRLNPKSGLDQSWEVALRLEHRGLWRHRGLSSDALTHR